jgi:hypothetical protein
LRRKETTFTPGKTLCDQNFIFFELDRSPKIFEPLARYWHSLISALTRRDIPIVKIGRGTANMKYVY